MEGRTKCRSGAGATSFWSARPGALYHRVHRPSLHQALTVTNTTDYADLRQEQVSNVKTNKPANCDIGALLLRRVSVSQAYEAQLLFHPVIFILTPFCRRRIPGCSPASNNRYQIHPWIDFDWLGFNFLFLPGFSPRTINMTAPFVCKANFKRNFFIFSVYFHFMYHKLLDIKFLTENIINGLPLKRHT